MRYHNYHKHDHKGNVKSLDCIVKMEDYCKRALELGHNSIFTTNHGFQGDIFEAKTLANQYGLKLIVGVEAYYVEDRFEKDRSNRHLIIIALNNDGVRDINRVMSEANKTGFYYKPRIDWSLIESINEKNVIITSACVAGICNEEDRVLKFYDKFKNNFFLEIQNHNDDFQKQWNRKMIELSNKYGIELIHGNDSHYIEYDGGDFYRSMFLKGKGIVYEEESSEFILDYPDYETILKRYQKQGVVNKEIAEKAIRNTLVFDRAEEITMINEDIKLPSISKNPNKDLKKILKNAWSKEKHLIPKNMHKKYMEAIIYETKIIEDTHMEDYFILDHEIVKYSKSKYSAILTNTGRGSAPSFYVNKLFGLTDMDRLTVPVPIYPTRFMSVERILGAKSLPDIDLNAPSREEFIKASEDILGKENCAWMISYKPLQESSAFRLWCKAKGLNINDYNEIAKNLDDYREDEYWGKIIEESKPFIGVIESISESPCSMLLYDKPVAEEIGLIRTGEKICCILDGYNCDKYKYLKNDYLQVTVWGLIKKTCELANIPIPTIKELEGLLDEKTFKIYEEGLTCTINQADSDFATGLIKRYKPKSIAEMSAFVAAIRPGFASLLDTFINRRPYSTGVKELDILLKDSNGMMMYQESIMKYLIWLGIDEPSSYDVIKKIAKKKFKESELKELKEKLLKGWMKNVGKIDGFEETWQVVEDAARYSFNASHSLAYAYDSLYGAYLKSHYPLEYYTVALNLYSDDVERTDKLITELGFFGIKINSPKFRYSKAEYMCDKETNSIYKGVGSLKFMNNKVADALYELRDKKYENFIEVLYDVKKSTSIDNRQMTSLIKLDYFEEFGKSKKLLSIYELFDKIADKKQISKEKMFEFNLKEENIRNNSQKETAKLFKEIDMKNLMLDTLNTIENKSISIKEKLNTEIEYLGYPDTTIPKTNKNFYFVLDLEIYKNKKSVTYYPTLYNIKTGEKKKFKIKDYIYFAENPFAKGFIIKIIDESKEPKRKLVNGKWTKSNSEYNYLINDWQIY